MKLFFDTSVLVAAFRGGHVHHSPSLRAFASAKAGDSACSAHTLAEVFATMTALPVKPAIPPEQALLFLDEIRRRLTPVAPTADDYFATIHSAAERGVTGGRIYDALHLQGARQCKARTIYTWNLRHFCALAPDLADRICTP